MNGERPRFLDTNILVYAHDVSAGPKHARAKALLTELWETSTGCLSVQVLQEFYVTMTRKVPKPLSAETAARIIADLGQWTVHTPGIADLLSAIDLHRQFGVSFWDAMILVSATQLNCAEVLSEDLNPGQDYAGVRVTNPFLLLIDQ